MKKIIKSKKMKLVQQLMKAITLSSNLLEAIYQVNRLLWRSESHQPPSAGPSAGTVLLIWLSQVRLNFDLSLS